jgi:anti-sigma factor RsiW
MRCDEAGRIIQLAEDGRAAAAGRARLEEHVAQCEPCRRLHAAHRNLRRLLASVPARETGPGFEARLAERLAQQPAASPVNAWWRRLEFRFSWRLLPTLATAGFAAAVAAWAILPGRPEQAGKTMAAKPARGVVAPPAHDAGQYQDLVDYSIAQSTHGSISESD